MFKICFLTVKFMVNSIQSNQRPNTVLSWMSSNMCKLRAKIFNFHSIISFVKFLLPSDLQTEVLSIMEFYRSLLNLFSNKYERAVG